MDTAKTGAYLASLRKNAGMTQQDAADRLGVSNKTISKWESGGGFPDITILPALAELYGVTADDILAGETVRNSSGGGQVAQYLARRGELRWRIGFSAAVLFLLAAILSHLYYWAWLALAGSAAAVWIGWSRCTGDDLRRRLVMLLPCAILLVYFLLLYFHPAFLLATALMADYKNGSSVVYYLTDILCWDMLLLLCCGPRRCGGADGGICCPGPIFGSWLSCGWSLWPRSSSTGSWLCRPHWPMPPPAIRPTSEAIWRFSRISPPPCFSCMCRRSPWGLPFWRWQSLRRQSGGSRGQPGRHPAPCKRKPMAVSPVPWQWDAPRNNMSDENTGRRPGMRAPARIFAACMRVT